MFCQPPEPPPERLNVCWLEAEEEVAGCVVAGKTGQAEHGVQHVVGAQPFGVGKAAGFRHDRQEEGRQAVGQMNGVVGGRFGKGQLLLHLPGKVALSQKGDEADSPPKGERVWGVLSKMSLVAPKREANSVRAILAGAAQVV
jgi:hypothetical protein